MMMQSWKSELDNGQSVKWPLHKACQEGDINRVQMILDAAREANVIDELINQPDDDARSAVFYSQLLGCDEVTELLASSGWTKLPEGTLMRGPGGRNMFWKYAEPTCSCTIRRSLTFSAWVPPRNTPAAAGQPVQRTLRLPNQGAKKDRQMLRRQQRLIDYRNAVQVVGPDHKFFPRKQVGGRTDDLPQRKRRIKPSLNHGQLPMGSATMRAATRPTGDATRLAMEEIYGGSDDNDESADETDLDSDVEIGDTVAIDTLTLASVARFVVDRRPVLAENGMWVILDTAEADEAAVVPSALEDDVLSLASFATDDDVNAEWPALNGRAPCVAERTAPLDDVTEEAWEALVPSDWDDVHDNTEPETCPESGPLMGERLSAWMGGAAATRLAVAHGVTRSHGGVAVFAARDLVAEPDACMNPQLATQQTASVRAQLGAAAKLTERDRRRHERELSVLLEGPMKGKRAGGKVARYRV